jgi:membrane protease subunit HflC
MRIIFVPIVMVAAVVGLLWAAQIDRGPIVINRADEYRLILRFGQPVAELTEPGFAGWSSVRIPFVDEVQVFDKKIQYLNAAATEIEIAENERLIIDYYVLWQIASPLDFRRSFPKGASEAKKRIQRTVGSLVGDAVGSLTMTELLARAEVLGSLGEHATGELESEGIRIVEVRINRTELPLPTENATFEQMREQRRAISRQKRAVGLREAREIRAKADREAREMVSIARARGEVLRGEGDAEAARIYAEAYGQDPEFYSFVRSLAAYLKTLGEGTTIVAPPSHEFFKYLDPKPSALVR